MASLVSRLWMKLLKKRSAISIMIVGLDNSGKTSILNYLSTLSQSNSSQQQQTARNYSHESDKRTSTMSSTDTRAAKSNVSSNLAPKDPRRKHPSANSQDNVSPTIGYNYERIHYKGISLMALDFSGQNRYRNLWAEFYNCVDGIVFVIDSSDLIRLVVVRDELETLLSHPYFGTLSGSDCSTVSDIVVGFNRQQPPIAAQKQISLNQGKLVQSPLENCSGSYSSLMTSMSSLAGKRNNSHRDVRRRTKIPILFLANKSDLANSVDTEVIVRALNLNQLPKGRHPWLIQATSVSSSQGIGEAFDWLLSQLVATSSTCTNPEPEPEREPKPELEPE